SVFSWPARVSRVSLAFLPDSVSGVPTPLRSLSSLSVAFVTSAEADLSELSVTFPFREVVSARTEVDQDASAEQRPSAQSAADVDWLLLLLPPHPAASVASATTAMARSTAAGGFSSRPNVKARWKRVSESVVPSISG